MKFKINDYVIEYEVIRKDNKNLYFRIDENCKLIITAPKFITDEEVRELITKNSKAILKMYEDALVRKEANKLFWYLGKSYNIIMDNRVSEVLFEDNNVICHDENTLNDFYLKECERVFEEERVIENI